MSLTQLTNPITLEKLEAPWRITFDTNPDDCNHHCIMCEEHSIYSPKNQLRIKGETERRRMDIGIIYNVVEECAPHGLREIIPSTMGEPLLYQHFPKIIEICHKFSVKLNLTTNGSFPGRRAKEWAELIVPVTSDVKISWNGVSREVQEGVMISSRLEKRLENLKTLLKERDDHTKEGGDHCSVTLQLTFMEINLHEIPDVVELAVNLGVDRVKGHHLLVHFDEIKEQNLRRNRESILQWNDVVRQCNTLACDNPLPSGNRIRLENFYELDPEHREELHPTAICPFLGQEAWINHSGRFDPCCAPDDLRKTLGIFGNVREGGLLRIWNSYEYEKLMKSYSEHELCRRCNMRKHLEEEI